MDFDQLVARINFLYKKNQKEELTEEEKAEQAVLRRQYIDAVKGNLRAQLERIKIVDGKDAGGCHGHGKDCDCGKH
ncbi:MAG: DUF896 domain-containing protein [Bacillota bacterium]